MEATANRRQRRQAQQRQPRVRLSWAAWESYLTSDVAIREMPARQRRPALAEVKGVRRRLTGQCCTVVWFEDVWAGREAAYPPPAENTPMRGCQCEACRRQRKLWPGHYVRTARLSWECWVERQPEHVVRQLPGSYSLVGQARMRECHRRGEDYDGGL